VLDRKWREHLYEMDYLREGITLRGYGQRDPLVEYQREGYDMFTTMMDGIKEDSVGNLFNFQVQVAQDPIVAENGGAGQVTGLAPAQPVQPAQPARPQSAPRGPQRAQPGQPGQTAPQRGGAQPGQGRRARSDQQPASGDGDLPAGLARPQRAANLSYSAPSDDASGRAQHSGARAGDGKFAGVGRNAPCPCGSGKKFKMCHGDPRNR
jgi:preprotein translocase subunit SecA